MFPMMDLGLFGVATANLNVTYFSQSLRAKKKHEFEQREMKPPTEFCSDLTVTWKNL